VYVVPFAESIFRETSIKVYFKSRLIRGKLLIHYTFISAYEGPCGGKCSKEVYFRFVESNDHDENPFLLLLPPSKNEAIAMTAAIAKAKRNQLFILFFYVCDEN
jgi:hypothetical protein